MLDQIYNRGMIEQEIPDIQFDLQEDDGAREVLIDYDSATRKFFVPEEALNVETISISNSASMTREFVSRCLWESLTLGNLLF